MAVGVLTHSRNLVSAPRIAIVSGFVSAALLALESVLGWLAPSLQPLVRYPLWVSLIVWLTSAAWTTAREVQLLTRRPLERRRASALALHLSLAVGFAAFAEGGLGAPIEQFALSAVGTNVHGERYRVLGVDSRIGRERAKRPVSVLLERTSPGGTQRLRVHYGQTWMSASGEYRLALSHHRTVTTGIRLRQGDSLIVVRPGHPVQTSQAPVALERLHDPRVDPDAGLLEAEVTLGSKHATLPFDPEWMGETAFVGLEESASVELLVRRRPSRAFAWVAALSAFSMIVFAWLGRTRIAPRLE